MHLFQINILIFNFWCLLHVSNPRVLLQEDGCTYRHGIVCFTCITISSLVGRRVCSNTPSGSKRADYINNYKIKYRYKKAAFCWYITYVYLEETSDHITSWCPILAKNEYLMRQINEYLMRQMMFVDNYITKCANHSASKWKTNSVYKHNHTNQYVNMKMCYTIKQYTQTKKLR